MTTTEPGYFSQGIAGDGAVILEDGQPTSIERVIELLNAKFHSPIQQLVRQHYDLLDTHPYAYFELAYTRTCGWMAWLTTHPSEQNPQRVVLARGQGDTPEEASQVALDSLATGVRQDTRRLWTVCYRDEQGSHSVAVISHSPKVAANSVASAGFDRTITHVFMGDLKDWRDA